MDIPVEKAGIHLSDELEEIKEDGRYRVKVRVIHPALKHQVLIKKKTFAGWCYQSRSRNRGSGNNRSGGLQSFEKFDNHKIKETYEVFCDEKKIDDVELGLSYLSKIE